MIDRGRNPSSNIADALDRHTIAERTPTMKKTLIASLLFALAIPAAALADGAAIYKTKCNACHGPDGSGQTPVGKNLKIRDLRSAEVQKQTDAELTKLLNEGRGKMPASKLSADDVKAVIAFVRGFKK
jgi:mono/diheme cytochrome c family protein